MHPVLLIILMGAASRWHGGGFFRAPRVVRAIVFAAPFSWTVPGNSWSWQEAVLSFAVLGCTVMAKNTGHEDFYRMGTGTPSRAKDRNTLTPVLMFFRLRRDSLAWCWAGMTLKGTLIALPAVAAAAHPILLLNGPAYALAYHLGRRHLSGRGGLEGTTWGEYLSGAFAGALLSLAEAIR